MVSHQLKIRTRYAETDQMGIVNNGHYLFYYEEGRNALIRDLGISYKEIEARGTMMPLIDAQIRYLKPAFFDEELTLTTSIKEKPLSKIVFHYEITNEKLEIINQGTTTLVFVDSKSFKPKRIPDFLADVFKPYF